MIELHLADHIAQRRLRQLLDGIGQIGDLRKSRARVGDLRIDQRVDFDDDVVL